MFRRERILDVYHAVESLCFYSAKEIAARMQIVDGALTLRVPHGPTVMRVVVADLLAVLPAHVVALRSITDEQAAEWFPAPDTHWGLASADALPEYRRRALTLLETLCEVAASGRHRRLYNAISAEVVNGAQDLAMLAALDLASKRKVKRRIGQKTDSPEQIADAAQFLELARTAAQTLKSVCTLYEWRDQYVAAAAACHPPRASRKPDGAPGSDTLLDAVVNAAFVALRRATPAPSVGVVKSVTEVAPARALLAGAARARRRRGRRERPRARRRRPPAARPAPRPRRREAGGGGAGGPVARRRDGSRRGGGEAKRRRRPNSGGVRGAPRERGGARRAAPGRDARARPAPDAP